MFCQPILQLGESGRAGLLQGSSSESPDPAIADIQRRGYLAMLSNVVFYGLSGLFDALFYTQGVDTIVLTVSL